MHHIFSQSIDIFVFLCTRKQKVCSHSPLKLSILYLLLVDKRRILLLSFTTSINTILTIIIITFINFDYAVLCMIFVNNRWYRQTFKGAKQTGTKRRNNDVHSYIIPKFNVVKNSQFSFYFLPHSPYFPTFHNCCRKLNTSLFCLMYF